MTAGRRRPTAQDRLLRKRDIPCLARLAAGTERPRLPRELLWQTGGAIRPAAEPDIDRVSAQTSGDFTAPTVENALTAGSAQPPDSGLSDPVDTAREAEKVGETAKEQVGQVAGEVGRQARQPSR